MLMAHVQRQSCLFDHRGVSLPHHRQVARLLGRSRAVISKCRASFVQKRPKKARAMSGGLSWIHALRPFPRRALHNVRGCRARAGQSAIRCEGLSFVSRCRIIMSTCAVVVVWSCTAVVVACIARVNTMPCGCQGDSQGAARRHLPGHVQESPGCVGEASSSGSGAEGGHGGYGQGGGRV